MSEHEHHEHRGHHHSHDEDISSVRKGRLFFVIIFNFIIALAEVIGGIISGSLSLISDAIHNLSDTASIILSFVSLKVSEKPKSKTKTYGYKRANILSAFVNSATLIGIAVFLVVEALRKFNNPNEIKGNIVIIVAIIGLLGNLFSVLLLKKGAKESINIRSSYLHLLSDALSSIAVIISGIIIKYLSIYWIDPILTIFINIVILKSSYEVLKESINILMQGTPLNMDVEHIRDIMLKVKEVKEVHHMHVWRLDEKNTIMECHIQLEDMLVSKTKDISNNIQSILEKNFNINHTVIQFESICCEDGNCNV